MEVLHNISLRNYNTFGIDVVAEHFVTLTDTDEVEEVTTLPYSHRVLGGGSNLLLSGPVDGLVVHNCLKGIAIEKEDDNHVWVRAAGGEVWHDLVLWAVNRGLGGIENLALIPGTVGAAPIQNIGAYGVEAKETIDTITFWYWKERTYLTYNNRDCAFAYRDSIFKRELKHRALITSVVFKLSKKPVLNTSYGAIEEELKHMGVRDYTVKAVAYAVMHIRQSKLPDPKVLGNAGSFYKNPVIGRPLFEEMVRRYNSVPYYKVSETQVKVPAAWLIEQCGWKGYKRDDAGVHSRQALVLVNYGHARGAELLQLSHEIIHSVRERFGVSLEREVEVWGREKQ